MQWVIAMRGRRTVDAIMPPILDNVPNESVPTDVHLFSILQSIAPLMGKIDQFLEIQHMCCPHQKSQIASALNMEVDQLVAELDTWRNNLSIAGLLYWDEDSTLYSWLPPLTSVPGSFATNLCFPSIRVATSMLFHWTGLLFLYTMKDAVPFELSVASRGNEGAPHTSRSPAGSLVQAMCLARSFEYFSHPDIGLFGTYLIGFPLAAARAYFEQRNMEWALSWIDVIDARIKELSSGLGDFLREVKTDNLLPAARKDNAVYRMQFF